MAANGAEKLMGQALALVKQGRLAEAENRFAQICEQDQGNGKAWLMRGVIRLEHGDRDGAIECLNTAVRLEPGNIEARFTLCQLFLAQGKLTEAIAQVEQVVELDAKHGQAWLALGSIYADVGQFTEAERASRNAIDLLPGAAEPKINLVNVLISQGKQDEAVTLCQNIKADNSAHAGIWHSLGLAFTALGLVQDAEQCLIKATRLEPRNAAALCALGELKAAQDEVSQALSLYKKSKKISPSYPRVHFQLGKVLIPNSSAKHRKFCSKLQRDHRYHDVCEAKDIAKELAEDFRFGDARVERALLRFFDNYDPSRLYPAQWWTDVLEQFGDRQQAADTALRSIFSMVFSWSLPCKQALDEIAVFAGQRLASYGSGSGYWEYLLHAHHGVDVVCHDMTLRHRFTAMQKTPHADAVVDLADTIFLAWLPGEGAIDAAIEPLLNQLGSGQKLVLVGEPADENGHPRSCGTQRFFRFLRAHFVTRATLPLANYAYFQDRVELLVKK